MRVYVAQISISWLTASGAIQNHHPASHLCLREFLPTASPEEPELILEYARLQLVYLIVVVSIGKSAVPIIAIAMIAAVYGLQAVIFILKREFMLIGWMVVYILA
jgi:hypothetical protein